MAFGSDDIWYHSVGKVYYRLDKNWKRADTWYQRGVQRSIGQSPCAPEDKVNELSEGPVLACNRDSDEYQTMIHRGSKMYFITWKNDTEVGSSDPTQVDECNWLDLQVVGNIRPDWFMDDRGDSTDVQYMGNQHVFHENEPRLVKQWRKKDFANQYFVMSILANPKEDGVHWPMILNVPGEGFGDDFLQTYTNQSLLTDDDDYLFQIPEALEAMDRTCKQMDMAGGGGPPTGQTVHIPSNLEVDENAWFSNVYTYSPVWEPLVSDAGMSMATGETGMITTEVGDVIVNSCYEESTKSVKMSVQFTGVEMGEDEEYPWLALGYRETEECLMNPRGGGDSEMIMLTSENFMEPHFGSLNVGARSFDGGAVDSIYASLTPLAEKDGFSDVRMQAPSSGSALAKSAVGDPSDSFNLHFKQSMAEVPQAMYLMYAIGGSAQVGYHKTRACFEITEFPSCPVELEGAEQASTAQQSVSSAGRVTQLLVMIVAGAASIFLV